MAEKKENKLKKWGEKFKSIFSKYPVTIIVILLLTLFMAFIYEEDGIFGLFDTSKVNAIVTKETLNKIMIFGFTYALSALFIESIFKKKSAKIVGLIVLAIIDIGFIMGFTYLKKGTDSFNKKFAFDWLNRYYAMYLITMAAVIVHKSFKSMETSLEEYLAKVTTNICKISIIYGVLLIGTLAISYGLIVELLELEESIILRLETLIFGLYYVPQLINALFDKDVTIGKFAKVMIRYVLEPLFICALLLLYAYFIKILVLHDMPKNMLYSIIASMFGCGFFIWTLNDYYKDETILYKINKYLPIAFVPALIMQAYCIMIRIMDNSMTVMRYVAVMLVVFEAIYILIYAAKKENVEKMLFVALAMIAIGVICPFVNASNISRMAQNDILKVFATSGKTLKEFSIDNVRTIQGAYNYLNDEYAGSKLMGETLTQEQIDDINSVYVIYDYKTEEYKISGQSSDTEGNAYASTYYINCKKENGAIDISGFDKLFELSRVSDYSVRKSIDETFKEIEFNAYRDDDKNLIVDRTLTVDLTELAQKIVDEYKETKSDDNAAFKANNIINLSENQTLVIKSFYIEYIPSSEKVYHYEIEAILLEK